MSNFIVQNHVIKKNIKEILGKLNVDSSYKLRNIKYSSDEVSIACPFHNNGKEKNNSCFIYVGEDRENLKWGTYHCFSCNKKGNIIDFIAGVLHFSKQEACEWLKSNFTEKILTSNLAIDDEIKLNEDKEIKTYLNESILDTFQTWHPYIAERHISKEIANQFQLRYDDKTKTIIFPVREPITNKLLFLTKRSIDKKQFFIDSSSKKTVYLLNEIIKRNIKKVIVVESQINALVAWSYGFPAIALFGAGTTEGQIEELNKTDILEYILMYDNDNAGRKGAEKFKKLIKPNVFVEDIIMPLGKDVADCSREEFWDILNSNLNRRV